MSVCVRGGDLDHIRSKSHWKFRSLRSLGEVHICRCIYCSLLSDFFMCMHVAQYNVQYSVVQCNHFHAALAEVGGQGSLLVGVVGHPHALTNRKFPVPHPHPPTPPHPHTHTHTPLHSHTLTDQVDHDQAIWPHPLVHHNTTAPLPPSLLLPRL